MKKTQVGDKGGDDSFLNRTAVCYARVSSQEQKNEGFSIPAQIKLLKSYAEQSNLRIIREFVDIESAKNTGRTNFSAMLDYMRKEQNKKQKACRIILVEKTDRLYRNLKDYVSLDQFDLELHFVKEGEILSRDSHSSSKFMHGIKVLMAKNFLDNLSEETRKGMMEKAEQGIYPSYAPVGYKNRICDGRRYIELDPEYAPLIKKLFEWYATGLYSLTELAEKAHEAGLVYRKSRKSLYKSMVHKILNNPIYYGEFRWGGRLFRGMHDPLITKELFEKVQEMLNEKNNCPTRHSKYEWAFQGLVHCGHCGCALSAQSKKGKYVYYHCTGAKGKCNEKYVREEELARQFRTALEAVQMDEVVIEEVVQALKSSHVDEKRFHDQAIAGLQSSYKKLQRRLNGLYEDKLDGKITKKF